MNQNPTITGGPSSWIFRVTTAPEPGGTGFGIQWYTLSDATRLAPNSVTSSFTFTSAETPAQLAALSPFDSNFHTTSSFIYQTASFQQAPTDPGFVFDVTVACFRAGTHISTTRGEVPVEMLRPGDLLLTERGEARPLRWIGRRHIRCDAHSAPDQVWPVRVTRDALGPAIPRTDLWLSPDHALYSDGVLIPVKHLINGTTITREPVDDVTYYHLELPSHDVILAEGAPAETYLDTGDRTKFDSEVMLLVPGVASPDRARLAREAGSDMELVVTGPLLAAIRGRIAERAHLLMTSKPADDPGASDLLTASPPDGSVRRKAWTYTGYITSPRVRPASSYGMGQWYGRVQRLGSEPSRRALLRDALGLAALAVTGCGRGGDDVATDLDIPAACRCLHRRRDPLPGRRTVDRLRLA